MAGRRQSLDRLIQALVWIVAVAQVYEHPVIAVDVRTAQWLICHRKDPSTVLSGRLRHQLFDPQAKALERLGDEKGEFVSATPSELTEGGAEPQPRVGRARVVVGAVLLGHLTAMQKRFHFDPHERGRHEAEE